MPYRSFIRALLYVGSALNHHELEPVIRIEEPRHLQPAEHDVAEAMIGAHEEIYALKSGLWCRHHRSASTAGRAPDYFAPFAPAVETWARTTLDEH
jgi:hypothetical protein